MEKRLHKFLSNKEKRIEILKLSGVKDVITNKITPTQKRDYLDEIYEKYKDCQRCILAEKRNNFVLGEGDADANIMFVGEGPGAQEDKTGRPFVGKAGKLFTKMLSAIDLSRQDVYITNIVKCRPPKNRDPRADEIKACLPFLYQQIKIIKPNLICALGKVAGNTLLEKQTSLSNLRNSIFTFQNTDLMVTYHPSALLYHPNWKRPAWEDLKKLRDKYL
ncbi:MAG: uracil-DNA glycosylase [Candidatus Cloacimonetes bacterium]|nr:uracil-DNA glycosylase [Candidatus Cloacimonadota bacterium]MBS3766637.1 uracil-DNA glycosylase [Candidatus Cloacimonadota bacterium]